MKAKPISAFSLLELLIVLAMLAILFSLLLPLAGRALEAARISQCMKNQNTIMTAAFEHAGDHDGALPATISTGQYQGPKDFQTGWLGVEAVPSEMEPPRSWYKVPGRLSPYYSGSALREKIFLCPSHDPGTLGSGTGSNGIHDYVMFSAFSGARISLLPTKASYVDPQSGEEVKAALPVFTEEDPAFGVNLQYIDMDHTTINRMGTWHGGQSAVYVSSDGSTHRVVFNTWPGPQAREWFASARNGKIVSLGNVYGFGGWNRL